ncbi:MAG TPA: hypothetical protein VGD53_19915 [Actinoallomurus sp.]
MRELIAPTTRLHTAWLEAHEEWGPGRHEDGFGLRPSEEVDLLRLLREPARRPLSRHHLHGRRPDAGLRRRAWRSASS